MLDGGMNSRQPAKAETKGSSQYPIPDKVKARAWMRILALTGTGKEGRGGPESETSNSWASPVVSLSINL
jgi:hypothetical protein